ncbi:TetR/AcrR family transcriptional regulator [Allosalinactinospora lopnorensis]|uniref:TetR/AcrR family transcriptional regulator n=1 Tax=Allosalinactinospora lopnorensis TaxID=1352348 RepID=UPI000623D752|nr:helix-turn-helix domain-containing protein [Allosalinactinospora lopnorensis]
MSEQTRTKLLAGALETLVENGIAKTSARSVAAAAGVNQGLIFYYFGSVDELLAAACRYGAEQRVARYRSRFAEVETLTELLRLGRELHAEERAAGHVATLAGLVDVHGLSRALAAGFVGLELYEGVDPDGTQRALAALEQLGHLVTALQDLGPVAQSAVRMRMRRAVAARGDAPS